MKPLTPHQIKDFVHMIAETREHEINCSECSLHMGEFAEREQAGLPTDEALEKVRHHLTLCPECREELEALEKILKDNP